MPHRDHFGSMRRQGAWMGGLLAFLIPALLAGPAVAQDEDEHDDWWKSVKISYHRSPTLSLTYGLTSVTQEDFQPAIAGAGNLQVKIGGSMIRWEDSEAGIINYKFEYFDLATIAPRLRGTSPGSDAAVESWRVGGSFESGLGYGAPESMSLILYDSWGFNWSKVVVPDQQLTAEELNTLKNYEGSLRFGTLGEGGVKVRVSKIFAIDAGYERSMIFPRTLFWGMVGSGMIERIIQWGADGFVDRVLDSSPAAAPVVRFVLKNGISWGFYELRKKQMNWPFNSAPGMLNDTWKVGLSMMF